MRRLLGRLRMALMVRSDRLRTAQWFYKSEPAAFTRLAEGQARPVCPACATAAEWSSDYPSRAKPFARHRVLYCTHCGLGFVRDMGAVLARYYREDYGRSNRGDRQLPPAEYFAAQVAGADPALEKYADRVQRQIDLLRQHDARFDRVLDYGSGPGYFLQASGAVEAHAIEPDEMSHKYLDYLGATRHADVQSLPAKSFDTIVASHVIEHLPSEELQPTLERLLAALAPGGRLLIEVPQGGHSYLRLAGHRQDPHTLFFTGQALVEAVTSAGGDILYQMALGRVHNPRREKPIYRPKGPPFFRTARGSLTVVCTAA